MTKNLTQSDPASSPTFRCAMCGETFKDDLTTEDEAMAEAMAVYGEIKADFKPVCDRCYQIFKPAQR